MLTTEQRVSRLEIVLEEFIKNVGMSHMRTEAEIREFKYEMKEFKDEMRAFKDEMRQQNREMNKKWGEIANKLGTITEDLVAPSLPRIINEEFSLEVFDLMVRRKRKLKDGIVKEYDAIAATEEYVFINYTKSALRSVDIDFFAKDIQEFRDFLPEFLPEYRDKKLIGVAASLYVDESVIRYAENIGFMVISVGDQLMEVKNKKGFRPKEW